MEEERRGGKEEEGEERGREKGRWGSGKGEDGRIGGGREVS